jgi:hypothetical protein
MAEFQASKGTPENVSGTILATRKAFGTNVAGGDDDIVNVGGNTWVTITNALKMGVLFRKADGSLGENAKAAAPTRTDA